MPAEFGRPYAIVQRPLTAVATPETRASPDEGDAVERLIVVVFLYFFEVVVEPWVIVGGDKWDKIGCKVWINLD